MWNGSPFLLRTMPGCASSQVVASSIRANRLASSARRTSSMRSYRSFSTTACLARTGASDSSLDAPCLTARVLPLGAGARRAMRRTVAGAGRRVFDPSFDPGATAAK